MFKLPFRFIKVSTLQKQQKMHNALLQQMADLMRQSTAAVRLCTASIMHGGRTTVKFTADEIARARLYDLSLNDEPEGGTRVTLVLQRKDASIPKFGPKPNLSVVPKPEEPKP